MAEIAFSVSAVKEAIETSHGVAGLKVILLLVLSSREACANPEIFAALRSRLRQGWGQPAVNEFTQMLGTAGQRGWDYKSIFSDR